MMQSLFSKVMPKAINSFVSNAFSLTQVANFSKYISKSRTKRMPLTTKRAGKGFYKGNRARKEGVISSKGRFRMVEDMCTELVVPELAGFSLKAYVGTGTKRHIREAVVATTA